MTYTPNPTWQDSPSTVTPINAAALNHIETGIVAVENEALAALVKASNLSDLASASTARTNLGLGGAATLNVGTTTGTVAAGDDSRIANAATKAQAIGYALVFGGI